MCGESIWRAIGKRTYSRSDISSLNEYERDRYRVLFEIWFPGQSEVELTSRLCCECAFVTYTPRPTAEDIKEKYLFLSALRNSRLSVVATEMNRKRARLLFRTLRRRLPSVHKARVLDYGGGDGSLMSKFLLDGCACFLIDYSESVCAGIKRVGSTEDDLGVNERFDVIICSHVIEHLADPLPVLRKLKEHLENNGIIYIELPMEIWGAAPLHKEPVTHVNFFTPAATKRLLERAGISPLFCKLGGCPHPSGKTSFCIRAVGKRGRPTGLTRSTEAVSEAEKLLNPDFGLRLKRRVLMPSTIPEALLYKTKRWMKRRRDRTAVGIPLH